MERILTSNYAYEVMGRIKGAREQIDILAYIYNCNLYKKSDRANLIFIELKRFKAKGKNIRIIFDYPKLHKSNYNAVKFFTRRFKEAAFEVRYLCSGTTQHAKLLLFDSELFIFGSHNLTTKSVVSPYDISLISDDPALLSTLVLYYSSAWSSSIKA